MQPDHVHVWAGTLFRREHTLTLLIVNLNDVFLQGEGHACVISYLVDGVGLRHPPIDAVQLDQDARLAKAVPVSNKMRSGFL